MTRLFRLSGGPTDGPADEPVELVLLADGEGRISVAHYGAPAGDLPPVPETRWGARADEQRPWPLLPGDGLGAFGHPALSGHRGGRDWTADFRLLSVDENDGLRLVLVDTTAALQCAVTLRLGADGVLTARTALTNQGTSPFDLHWLAAIALPLPQRFTEALGFTGDWAQEFQTERFPLPPGLWLRESRQGRPGHMSFPAVVIGPAGFGENAGEAVGLHLGWSGNHRLLVERLPHGGLQLQAGELLMPGEVRLQPGETYQSPEAFIAWSMRGLNGISQRFHAHLRERILPQNVRARPRPVHLNTWEAVYFDHGLEALKELAALGAETGVERFVLDDGWFKGRKDDRAGLGDWWPDPATYPDGLGPLIDHVQSLGMEFGLWVEPEMANPDSDLLRAHPDWALSIADRPAQTMRNQLVLDLQNPEVSNHLFEKLDGLLRDHEIAYLKWDMNRDLTEAGHEGQPASRGQTLALYALLDRLRRAHPTVEIETCASGGGRADFGILKRTHRFWASDNNDPLDRHRIDRGASLFFPPEVTGSHVGPSPAHITGRASHIDFRAHCALLGHFGIETDLRTMAAEDRARLAEHVSAYKKWRGVIHGGTHWRLETDNGDCAARMAVSPEDRRAVAVIARTGNNGGLGLMTVRFQGLDAKAHYRLSLAAPASRAVIAGLPGGPTPWESGGIEAGGAALMSAGLGLQLPRPGMSVALAVEPV